VIIYVRFLIKSGIIIPATDGNLYIIKSELPKGGSLLR